MKRLHNLIVMAPLLLLVGDVAQQPLPSEAPTTVIAISWAIVLAEAFVIGVLWRALNEEKEKRRSDAEATRSALSDVLEINKDMKRALNSLDDRLDVSGDVRELLRRTEG